MKKFLPLFVVIALAPSVLFSVGAQAEVHVALKDVDAQPVSMTQPAQALDQAPAQVLANKFQTQITLHTAEELRDLLLKAEKLASGETQYSTSEPIAVILHGEEIKSFLRTSYRDNKELVDLAARLDAFRVIDIKVCQRFMGGNGISAGDLPPFIEPVSWGAGEVSRLQKEEGYAFF